MKLRVNSFIDVLKHLGIIIGISVGLVLFFFYVYLPATTNHGETITVPDIKGMHIDDLESFLLPRNLRFEVNDSAYSKDQPPLIILNQYPPPGSKVKEDRKIYISINRVKPPTTRMPKLVDRSLKNAEAQLESYELELGKVIWQSSPNFNAVLEQRMEGDEVEEGEIIPKGSVIDLVVGDGYGKNTWRVDDLRGMSLEEAKVYIMGSDLELGDVYYEIDSNDASGVVVNHIPQPGRIVRLGQSMDLWIGRPGSLTEPEGEVLVDDEGHSDD